LPFLSATLSSRIEAALRGEEVELAPIEEHTLKLLRDGARLAANLIVHNKGGKESAFFSQRLHRQGLHPIGIDGARIARCMFGYCAGISPPQVA
jgi:hypothetical protein